jgi:hypothetical protein
MSHFCVLYLEPPPFLAISINLHIIFHEIPIKNKTIAPQYKQLSLSYINIFMLELTLSLAGELSTTKGQLYIFFRQWMLRKYSNILILLMFGCFTLQCESSLELNRRALFQSALLWVSKRASHQLVRPNFKPTLRKACNFTICISPYLTIYDG